MALPFLPGNSFNPSLGKTKYHKSHHFDVENDVTMLVGEAKPGIGGERLPWQKNATNNSVIPRGSGTDLPAWVAFDRQVLSFEAFFQEAVHEKREEQFRIRHCKIYFYLEDDSIQVIEPRAKNAGIPQGTIIRRHRIPRPAPNDDTFYTVEDFNVGKEISFYSRVFKITACDKFTENFLGKLGVRIPKCSQLVSPDDPYSNHRKALDESLQPLRPYERFDTLKQFLDHDRHVLRFFGYWDDTNNMFGDCRELVIHYFLADDTIEIREIIPANSGRDAVPNFLKRGKLPKCVEDLQEPGKVTQRTVLNVFGPMGHGGRYILDSLKTGAHHVEYYKDSDLTVGTVLNVWGRKVVLCDCDDFTKEYYHAKYGVESITPIKYKRDPGPRHEREVPPYNGFGGEEDSLNSSLSLLPKPPKRDFIKFMEKDRHGFDSNVLRFLARFETAKPIDLDRRFIISYFLSDDTILVFEPPIRNSGIIGGKFLERQRIKKPDQEKYSTTAPQYFQANDLFVGNVVEFNRFNFLLIDADEYAYNYMERHGDEFLVGNIGRILSKLGEAAAPRKEELMRHAPEGSVPFERFKDVVSSIGQGVVTPHEVMTVARFYQEGKEEMLSLDDLASMIQGEVQKACYNNLQQLQEQCEYQDPEKTCKLDTETLRSIAHTLQVPVKDDMLRALFSKLPGGEPGKVNYNEFVKVLNWQEHPALPSSQHIQKVDENWQGNKPVNQIKLVNLGLFITDLFGETCRK